MLKVCQAGLSGKLPVKIWQICVKCKYRNSLNVESNGIPVKDLQVMGT